LPHDRSALTLVKQTQMRDKRIRLLICNDQTVAETIRGRHRAHRLGIQCTEDWKNARLPVNNAVAGVRARR